MDAQERSAVGQIAHDHRHRCLDMSAAVQNLALESEDLKHSPLGWLSSGGNLPDCDRWCHLGPAFGLRGPISGLQWPGRRWFQDQLSDGRCCAFLRFWDGAAGVQRVDIAFAEPELLKNLFVVFSK